MFNDIISRLLVGRDSDSLRAARSGHRIPVVARFSVPVQTGTEVHPTSYTMGTGYLSPGAKWQRPGFDHPPSSSADVIARTERDGTLAETRFRLSPKRTSPFKSVGASVQSTAGSQGVRISLSNAG